MRYVRDAQCFEVRPADRDYNAKGGKRDPRPESIGGGIMLRAKDVAALHHPLEGGCRR